MPIATSAAAVAIAATVTAVTVTVAIATAATVDAAAVVTATAILPRAKTVSRESTRGRTDRNANGCPDFASIPDLRASIAGVVKGSKVVGVRFTRLRFRSRAPRGTRVRVSCRPRRNCKLRRRGSLRRRIRSLRFRTKRTKVTIKATKSGYVGKVFTMTVTFRTTAGGGSTS